jgi:OOP family OmpA-OmpF porin/outer membrane immunogenic protein
MKNMLSAIALATAGLLSLPAAQAADNTGGFFINGNIGQSNLSKGAYDDNDTGYSANIGYRWAVTPSVLLGIEGGYTDLGKFSPKSSAPAGLGDAKVKGWNLGVDGHFNVAENWYLSGRTGYFRADTTGAFADATITSPDGTVTVPVVRVSDTSNKWYAGAGFGYDFSNNFSLGLNYDYYKAGLDLNPSLVSVSGEYRF